MRLYSVIGTVLIACAVWVAPVLATDRATLERVSDLAVVVEDLPGGLATIGLSSGQLKTDTELVPVPRVVSR